MLQEEIIKFYVIKLSHQDRVHFAFAFEQLKINLKQGYFDGIIKNSKISKKIAIVTSPTGAAIEDMKK